MEFSHYISAEQRFERLLKMSTSKTSGTPYRRRYIFPELGNLQEHWAKREGSCHPLLPFAHPLTRIHHPPPPLLP